MTTNRQPSVPSYRLHKASAQAVVTLNGKDHYLGRHGSEKSRDTYDRLIALYLAGGRRLPSEVLAQPGDGDSSSADSAGETIATLCDGFLDWTENEYLQADGTISREATNVKIALRPLLKLYASLPADSFGPKALLEYRQALIDADLSRGLINQRVQIVKRAFRWACREERIPPSIYHSLTSVEGLKRGRCGVRETKPVECVPEPHIEAALPFMPPPICALVQLQLLTGARPGELVILRPCDIDQTGSVWLYRPTQHKNAWRGHARIIPIGARGQAIIHEFLRPGYQERFLFSPTLAERERQRRRRAARKTPLTPSDLRAQESRRRRQPKRVLRGRYDVITYAQAVRRACKKAGVPAWSPGQLRHNAGTKARREFGLERSGAHLGHRNLETTQIYADTSLELAIEIAAKVG